MTLDLAGQTLSRLTVIRRVERPNPGRHAYRLCVCACDLCDQRESEYGTPLSHHECHLIAWVLWTVSTHPTYSERFDRERFTRDEAAA